MYYVKIANLSMTDAVPGVSRSFDSKEDAIRHAKIAAFRLVHLLDGLGWDTELRVIVVEDATGNDITF